ncbi:hypothetical protein GOP47_0013343 [Adiantum capillus-veneris]|uniref:Glutaminyl-tRNA synthetase n=1 Tax=Adiantum capillus-veneris TaxID=13818 RepID=A0A9D4ZEG1_ADICA|nr:hypothetical protein GOP47_0013343 [Adiantum capillus-veneris]
MSGPSNVKKREPGRRSDLLGPSNMKARELFLSIGLDDRTATNALANAKVTSNLTDVIHEAGVDGGCDKNIGNLIYMVATKFPTNALNHRAGLVKCITGGQIKSTLQLEAAFSFFSSTGPRIYDIEEFEKHCDVGVEVSVEEIRKVVKAVMEGSKSQILAERYRINVGILLGKVRKELPWADGKTMKEEFDTQMKAVLGEKTEQDDKKTVQKKKEKASQVADGSIIPAGAQTPAANYDVVNPFSIFPDPRENNQVHVQIFFSNGTIWRPKNTPEKLQRHLQFTGGHVYARFPPEPNGYLHIGHAKALFVSFGLAKERGGKCYLRYDDTNPEAEKQEYIDHIQEIVDWMGWKPFKVTYCSNYFQELYDFAVQLIKKGYAYVDHQTPEEIKSFRESKTESPWRNRPIAESLRLFDDMKNGLIEEGKATLRMKQDMKNENPNMYDLIAYRIKNTPHPHTKDKWHMYPSYDYSHCIVDSLENITHSLCTLEFEIRRPVYYWVLEALDLYHPYVWEYSRLCITNTVLSKRKLNRLVTDKWVDGWDDPRLMTLAGLRRRGLLAAGPPPLVLAPAFSRSTAGGGGARPGAAAVASLATDLMLFCQVGFAPKVIATICTFSGALPYNNPIDYPRVISSLGGLPFTSSSKHFDPYTAQHSTSFDSIKV